MSWKRNLWVLSTATFIAAVGFSLTTPFLPRFLQDLGLKQGLSMWSGIMFAVNSATYAIMAPVWGSLADRHGKRVMLLRSGLGIAATYVLMGICANHWQLLGLRALNGVLSGFIPSSIMLVATNTPDMNLGFALGIIQTAVSMGNIMGPAIGGYSAKLLGVRSTFFMGAAVLAVAAIWAFLGTREVVKPPAERTSVVRDVFSVMDNKVLRVVILSQLLVQTSLMVIQPTLMLFVQQITRANAEVVTGVLFSVAGLSMAIGAPLLGKIKNANYLGVMVIGTVAGGVMMLVQGLSRSTWMLGGERFVFGFANAAMAVSASVLLAQYADPSERGRTFGVYNGITSLGSVFGPLLGGVLGESFGLASPFFGSAIVLFVSAWMIYTGLNARQAVLETQLGARWNEWTTRFRNGRSAH